MKRDSVTSEFSPTPAPLSPSPPLGAATHRNTQQYSHISHCYSPACPCSLVFGLHDVIFVVTTETPTVMDGSILVASCTGQRIATSPPPQVGWTACDAVWQFARVFVCFGFFYRCTIAKCSTLGDIFGEKCVVNVSVLANFASTKKRESMECKGLNLDFKFINSFVLKRETMRQFRNKSW